MYKIMMEFSTKKKINFAPIHYAAEKGFFDIVQLLGSFKDCNVNLLSNYGIFF